MPNAGPMRVFARGDSEKMRGGGEHAAAPASQLLSLRILHVIAYRKWNFGVMDVARAF